MLENKQIEEIKRRVKKFVDNKEIIKGKPEFVKFFLTNSKNSLDTARLLFEASTKQELKEQIGLVDFNGFLWVINSSYYSMFYVVRALLENEGIKIKTDFSLHAVVFDLFVYYFYLTEKLEKSFIEDFQDAGIEASETLGKEKAKNLVEDYFYEKGKRGRFTYEMGEIAMKNKALTSLERAKKFNEEIRKMLELR